ncbi:MAG TPA: fibronectin type III domain-containing protein, partial [Gemmatimonadales bacterium]
MTTRRLCTLAFVLFAACGDDGTQPPPNLEAPTGVTAQATSATTAQVSWAAVTGAVTYTIQRAQGASGGTFLTVGSSATTSFDDSGLNAETQYRYRVQAVSGSAQSAFSTEIGITTPPATIPTVEVTADITTNTTWIPTNKYVLKGFIHVASGATLTILPGTKVVGDFNTVGSSLFVLRGARIVAEGNAQAPIVFTSSRAEGQRQAGDWGGLILVGNGVINRSSPVILEGTGTGTDNPAVDYSGGTSNTDNSGSLSYVRVEFAGYAIAQDTELNSFTFAAVGGGTRCDHLQSLNGLDDAFEFFGGAVNCLNLVSYNSGD